MEFVGKISRFLEIKKEISHMFGDFSRFLYLGPLWIFMATIE